MALVVFSASGFTRTATFRLRGRRGGEDRYDGDEGRNKKKTMKWKTVVNHEISVSVEKNNHPSNNYIYIDKTFHLRYSSYKQTFILLNSG